MDEILDQHKAEPETLAFQASSALQEGSIFGGIYFAPLLSILFPRMWAVAAARYGQVLVLTLGRTVPGLGQEASRDSIDALSQLAPYSPSPDFVIPDLDRVDSSIHRTTYSDTIDWWTRRMNAALKVIYSPNNYEDRHGQYSAAVHQRWMLNFEQLLTRIAAIGRHPRDKAVQLMLLFPAMDLVGDSFTGSGGIGQLMTPKRLDKKVAEIERKIPPRVKPLISSLVHRASNAAKIVADGFFVPSTKKDATDNSRLEHLWNARRNATHGFTRNNEILAEHNGALPADIVLVPFVYLLDIVTDTDGLRDRIRRSCG